jgi:hypothetical protein
MKTNSEISSPSTSYVGICSHCAQDANGEPVGTEYLVKYHAGTYVVGDYADDCACCGQSAWLFRADPATFTPHLKGK